MIVISSGRSELEEVVGDKMLLFISVVGLVQKQMFISFLRIVETLESAE